MKRWMVFFAFVLLAFALINIVAAEENLISTNNASDGSENESGIDRAGPLADRDIVVTRTTKLPDVAMKYCENQGYLAETRADSTGKEYNVCVFGDGNECRTLEFMRGSCGRDYVSGVGEKIVSWLEKIKGRIEERNCEDGCWVNVEGKNITIRDLSAERREIIAGKINARTGLNLSAEDIDGKLMLRAYLSNGRWALIKHMPDAASEKAVEAMKAKCEERNCTVELKEVSIGGKTKLAYEVSTDKESRVLLLFRGRMPIAAQVDAETGEVIAVKRPWWAFLASEKDESQ